MKAANLALKFVLELVAFASLWYWGASVASGAAAVALAIAAPAAAIAVWARWCAPKSPTRLPAPSRIPLELLVFSASALALASAGRPGLAAIFAVLIALNAAGLQAWSQWDA